MVIAAMLRGAESKAMRGKVEYGQAHRNLLKLQMLIMDEVTSRWSVGLLTLAGVATSAVLQQNKSEVITHEDAGAKAGVVSTGSLVLIAWTIILFMARLGREEVGNEFCYLMAQTYPLALVILVVRRDRIIAAARSQHPGHGRNAYSRMINMVAVPTEDGYRDGKLIVKKLSKNWNAAEKVFQLLICIVMLGIQLNLGAITTALGSVAVLIAVAQNAVIPVWNRAAEHVSDGGLSRNLPSAEAIELPGGGLVGTKTIWVLESVNTGKPTPERMQEVIVVQYHAHINHTEHASWKLLIETIENEVKKLDNVKMIAQKIMRTVIELEQAVVAMHEEGAMNIKAEAETLGMGYTYIGTEEIWRKKGMCLALFRAGMALYGRTRAIWKALGRGRLSADLCVHGTSCIRDWAEIRELERTPGREMKRTFGAAKLQPSSPAICGAAMESETGKALWKELVEVVGGFPISRAGVLWLYFETLEWKGIATGMGRDSAPIGRFMAPIWEPAMVSKACSCRICMYNARRDKPNEQQPERLPESRSTAQRSASTGHTTSQFGAMNEDLPSQSWEEEEDIRDRSGILLEGGEQGGGSGGYYPPGKVIAHVAKRVWHRALLLQICVYVGLGISATFWKQN